MTILDLVSIKPEILQFTILSIRNPKVMEVYTFKKANYGNNNSLT